MSKNGAVRLHVLKKGQEGALPGLKKEGEQVTEKMTQEEWKALGDALHAPFLSMGPVVLPNLRTETAGHHILVDVILRPQAPAQRKLPPEIRGRLFFRLDTQPTGSEEEVQRELERILAEALLPVPDAAAKDSSHD